MALAVSRGGEVTRQSYHDAVKRLVSNKRSGLDYFRIQLCWDDTRLEDGLPFHFMADSERAAVVIQLEFMKALHSFFPSLELNRTLPIGRPEVLMHSRIETPVGILKLHLIWPSCHALRY